MIIYLLYNIEGNKIWIKLVIKVYSFENHVRNPQYSYYIIKGLVRLLEPLYYCFNKIKNNFL